ncbi:hypothetical protein LK430_08675 [Acidaminococcus fermentans DSM 20731]|uniref:hypothetical protein n=1 Tax=Acidaminococcus fermentans TaxID=905 RepID=UPI0005A12C2D|nr:hypothetical protein [Acidaminococcus fermentans]UEA71914.1 hypothetical protein LK430_08675 [Acidaminococcus fermentans DSM 20731]
MERYYDLVMANALQEYARKSGLPGVAPEGASEEERWEAAKRELSGSRLGVITEWGFIDFDPSGLKNLVGGEGMSYEEYLELQKASGDQVRHDLEKAYYENCWVACKGQIEKSTRPKAGFALSGFIWVPPPVMGVDSSARKTMCGWNAVVLNPTRPETICLLPQKSIAM